MAKSIELVVAVEGGGCAEASQSGYLKGICTGTFRVWLVHVCLTSISAAAPCSVRSSARATLSSERRRLRPYAEPGAGRKKMI